MRDEKGEREISMHIEKDMIAQFHLPGLFEFYEFYKVFLPLYFEHREFFYEWVNIASIYGCPEDCIWGGGREGVGNQAAGEVFRMMQEYGISARLTFSNSLLKEEHLADRRCNRLCEVFGKREGMQNGVIVHSELLLEYLKSKYPSFYFVSSTTKVITDFEALKKEVDRAEFAYVVPDFRLNKEREKLSSLEQHQKNKIEFLCNECCYIGCKDRKKCYENVSKMILGEESTHTCQAPGGDEGYLFSKAMKSSAFIGIEDIQNWYLPNGFTNFKIEGRTLGSAVVLEMLLYYLVKTEHQLEVREKIYLDSMLHLF